MPPDNNARAQHSQIVNVLARYTYSRILLHSGQSFTLDFYEQDSQHDTDIDLDMLPDEETSTG
jgi:hypothetical protein